MTSPPAEAELPNSSEQFCGRLWQKVAPRVGQPQVMSSGLPVGYLFIPGDRPSNEFQQFSIPGDGRKFTEIYNVQLLSSNAIDPVCRVAITTIQRLYSILKGEPEYDPGNEQPRKWLHGGVPHPSIIGALIHLKSLQGDLSPVIGNIGSSCCRNRFLGLGAATQTLPLQTSGPVEHDRNRLAAFPNWLAKKEFLTVAGRDVLGRRYWIHSERSLKHDSRRIRLQAGSAFHLDRHHLSLETKVEKLPAVPSPVRLAAPFETCRFSPNDGKEAA